MRSRKSSSAWRATRPIGPYLVLGSGGVLVELVGDSAILMLPASDSEIRDGARRPESVRPCSPGYRGKPAGDIGALVATVRAIQSYAIANIDRLLELDVNPVMVRPHGAVAVDALIRLEGADMTDAPFLVTREAGVMELTLCRGKANAIDAATSRALGRHVRGVPRRPGAARGHRRQQQSALLLGRLGPDGGRRR